MALRQANTFVIRLFQSSNNGFLAPSVPPSGRQFVRHINKHWNPKWKLLRRLKVIKTEIPNFREDPEDLTEEQVRSKMKEKGILPTRRWVEKPYFIASTGAVFEPYVPPEGDGKVSPVHLQGAKQKLQVLEKKSKTMMAVRKIRTFDEDFDTPQFCKEAEKIYIKMHECLVENDLENITSYVTEKAYPEVIHNTKNKTIRWKFIKAIELPRVVHARCTDVVSKQNVFAQVTVRFHSQQVFALYDRFGRLMHGSEIIAKDVLEYVVFEKHLANEYGIWRIHAKIIPDWLPPKEPTLLTYAKPVESDQQVEEVVAENPPQAEKSVVQPNV